MSSSLFVRIANRQPERVIHFSGRTPRTEKDSNPSDFRRMSAELMLNDLYTIPHIVNHIDSWGNHAMSNLEAC